MYILLILMLIIIFSIIIVYNSSIFRNYKINNYPVSYFIEKYKTKKKKINDKIIVCMEKTDNIENTVKSLLDQTDRIDEIIVNSRDKFTPSKELKDIISVYICNKNYGKFNNFIPTVIKEKCANTIVITIKGGVIYNRDFINKMTQNLDKKTINKDLHLDNNCMSFRCGIFDSDFFQNLDNDYDNYLNNYFRKYKINYVDNIIN